MRAVAYAASLSHVAGHGLRTCRLAGTAELLQWPGPQRVASAEHRGGRCGAATCSRASACSRARSGSSMGCCQQLQLPPDDTGMWAASAKSPTLGRAGRCRYHALFQAERKGQVMKPAWLPVAMCVCVAGRGRKASLAKPARAPPAAATEARTSPSCTPPWSRRGLKPDRAPRGGAARALGVGRRSRGCRGCRGCRGPRTTEPPGRGRAPFVAVCASCARVRPLMPGGGGAPS